MSNSLKFIVLKELNVACMDYMSPRVTFSLILQSQFWALGSSNEKDRKLKPEQRTTLHVFWVSFLVRGDKQQSKINSKIINIAV